MRSIQTELFSRFLPSTYCGHVNLAPAKPWRFMPKYQDGDTVEFNICGAVGYNVIGVYRWILPATLL